MDHDVVLEVCPLDRVDQVLVGFLVSWLVLGILVVRTRIVRILITTIQTLALVVRLVGRRYS